MFPNLIVEEHTGLRTIKNQLLKNNDKFQQYTDDNLPSQNSGPGLPMTVLHSEFDEIHEHFHAGLHIAQYN